MLHFSHRRWRCILVNALRLHAVCNCRYQMHCNLILFLRHATSLVLFLNQISNSNDGCESIKPISAAFGIPSRSPVSSSAKSHVSDSKRGGNLRQYLPGIPRNCHGKKIASFAPDDRKLFQSAADRDGDQN